MPTAWQDYMASQDTPDMEWRPGNPAYERAAKCMHLGESEGPPEICFACGHDFGIGWRQYGYVIDIEFGDRFILQWGGWYSPCAACNPQHTPPDGVTLLTFDPATPVEPFEDWM